MASSFHMWVVDMCSYETCWTDSLWHDVSRTKGKVLVTTIYNWVTDTINRNIGIHLITWSRGKCARNLLLWLDVTNHCFVLKIGVTQYANQISYQQKPCIYTEVNKYKATTVTWLWSLVTGAWYIAVNWGVFLWRYNVHVFGRNPLKSTNTRFRLSIGTTQWR